jgi:hypothetical protein
MSTMLGSASRARELQKLFETWTRACDRQDVEMMAVVRRVIDATIAGGTPGQRDMAVIRRYPSLVMPSVLKNTALRTLESAKILP